MFAYVIIAVELAILYTVFWYIFLREPQPYKVVGDPWGRYEARPNRIADEAQTPYCAEVEEIMQARSGIAASQSLDNLSALRPHSRHNVQNSQSQRLCVYGDLKYGWVVAGAPARKEQEDEPSAVARLFSKFQQTLEGLSVKL